MSTSADDDGSNQATAFLGCCGDTPKPPSTRAKAQAVEHPAVQEIDSLIAKEMFQLSMKEREKALDDVHGIAAGESEDPNFINSCLMHLEQSLSAMKANTVYEEAEHLSEEFVRNPHFRVMFLRAEHYEPHPAAERMLRFFALKKELFGRDKLVRKITLRDMNQDDMECLSSGEGQISPFTDTAGRPVATFVYGLRKSKDVIHTVRLSGWCGLSEGPRGDAYWCLSHPY